MYDWVLNTPFEGSVQNTPLVEPAIAPVVESLRATT